MYFCPHSYTLIFPFSFPSRYLHKTPLSPFVVIFLTFSYDYSCPHSIFTFLPLSLILSLHVSSEGTPPPFPRASWKLHISSTSFLRVVIYQFLSHGLPLFVPLLTYSLGYSFILLLVVFTYLFFQVSSEATHLHLFLSPLVVFLYPHVSFSSTTPHTHSSQPRSRPPIPPASSQAPLKSSFLFPRIFSSFIFIEVLQKPL